MCGPLPIWEQHLLGVLVFVGFAVWEQWLGRTKKTTAASTLDLMKSGILKLFGKKQQTELVVKDGSPTEGVKNGNS